ncbi:hypothetical protein EDM52_11970 [Brevibacillus invocatus]|uniref:DUF6843 domain-containing protein n=2 Tax=Brevibacillus invocatus TaxID=173959 RepID=A0A3M8CF15_9BACL|nr:hypothetical protein EDM52_11970 [Brevibacillus invocatus]
MLTTVLIKKLTTMAKIKISVAIVFILLFAGIAAFIFTKGVGQKGVDQTFLLPMDFEGCVVIYYDHKDALPLQIVNNEIIYSVPKDGVIRTSSPMEFGWVNKNSSGAYRTRAFYVDRYGKKIDELPQEDIRFGATGSVQEQGGFEQKHFYQIFGSEEVEERRCPQLEG